MTRIVNEVEIPKQKITIYKKLTLILMQNLTLKLILYPKPHPKPHKKTNPKFNLKINIYLNITIIY